MFDPQSITQIEVWVARQIARGEAADCHWLDRHHAEQAPELRQALNDERLRMLGLLSIRASFLRHLLLGLPGSRQDHQYILGEGGAEEKFAARRALFDVALTGVRVRGAFIEGPLNLTDSASVEGGLPQLVLEQCVIPEEINLSHARLARLSLRKSRITTLRAPEIVVTGSLDLSEVEPLGEEGDCRVTMRGALVEGDFWASRSHFRTDELVSQSGEQGDAADRFALKAPDAEFRGSVDLTGVTIEGGVSFDAADIAGDLIGIDAVLKAKDRPAFSFDHGEIRGGLHFKRLQAQGAIVLIGAQIGGSANFDAAMIEGVSYQPNAQIKAISAENCRIGALHLCRGFVAHGQVDLTSAQIARNLDCDNGRFLGPGPNGQALAAQDGESRSEDLLGERDAIRAQNLEVGGDVFMGDDPEFPLEQARNSPAAAFVPQAAHDAAGPTDLTRKQFYFFAKGRVNLRNATIGGDIKFDKGRFLAHENGAAHKGETKTGEAINIENAEIEDALDFSEAHIVGRVVLRHANCDVLKDSGNPWAQVVDLQLHGFTYKILDVHAENAPSGREGGFLRAPLAFLGLTKPAWKKRRDWIELSERAARNGARRNAQFAASQQPYAQAARVMRATGHLHDARMLDIARLEAQTRCAPFWRKPDRWLWQWSFGYGLSPWRAFRTVMITLLFGWWMVWVGNQGGMLVVDAQTVNTTKIVAQGGPPSPGMLDAVGGAPADLPCGDQIDPLLYALDIFLPIIDLRQESECEPPAKAIAIPDAAVYTLHIPFTSVKLGTYEKKLEPWPHAKAWPQALKAPLDDARWWRLAKSIYALLGAILTSLAIITFTGVLRHSGDE